MQMCIQCNNKTKPTSTVGMLFPRYFVLGCNDYAFLLPGKVTMFLRWNYVLDYVIVFFYCTDRRITLQSNVSNDSLVRNVWSMQHATLRIVHVRGRTLTCIMLHQINAFFENPTDHFDWYQVRNTGSWMEIGNSISHFGIVSAQVVFVLLLFAVTNIYTKDINIGSADRSSRKAM